MYVGTRSENKKAKYVNYFKNTRNMSDDSNKTVTPPEKGGGGLLKV